MILPALSTKVITDDIKRKVKDEIGDLLWNDTRELIPSAKRVRHLLEARGFRKRSGMKYDWVKYIATDVRIHIKMEGKQGKAFYHIDFH